MEKEVKQMNIYQRMSAITAEVGTVAKNKEIGFGREKYRVTLENVILAAIKPLEEKYGVYSYPIDRKVIDTNIFTKATENKTSTTLFMRIETTYRFVNIDNPQEFIDIKSYGDGVDPQDKAPGKAMTYSDKYALMKAYKIETGDDPDNDKSEDMGKADKLIEKPAKKETPLKWEKPFVFTQEDIYELCRRLGRSIESTELYSADHYGTNIAALKPEQRDELGNLLWTVAEKNGRV